MRVQLRDPHSLVLLDELDLDDLADAPQPGRWLEHGGRSFLVLQRSHRYRLRDCLRTVGYGEPSASPAPAGSLLTLSHQLRLWPDY